MKEHRVQKKIITQVREQPVAASDPGMLAHELKKQAYARGGVMLFKIASTSAVCAFALIAILVYAIPHLPISKFRTFQGFLRVQTTLDESNAIVAQSRKPLLVLGSSVVERGIPEHYLTTTLAKSGLGEYTAINAGIGGFFTDGNLAMFKAMLRGGMKPSRVVYGFFLQELNGVSNVHSTIMQGDSSELVYRSKSLLNVVRFGANSLHPLFSPLGAHIYLFAYRNAFREVDTLNAWDQMLFGANAFERDSTYKIKYSYLKDLESIVDLCAERKIPIAFYHSPLNPNIGSLADLPYLHKDENYKAIESLARSRNIPIWNFDHQDRWSPSDFQDTYHLSPRGARKLADMLSVKLAGWERGEIEQDRSM